jgi:predicted O-linked N-acetylglucosamine transferase (SPINDLY family)
LRVGYLSSDLHDHATAHLMAGLFERHDPARIESFAYASDRDDGSAMRQRLRRAFGHWTDIRALSDDEAARRIESDALDILVDLKGHTHGTRIAMLAQRPAPVQLHYLGFPGTIAYDAIDGFIADEIVAPPGCEAEFAEPLLRLPVCYQVNDSRRLLPAAALRGAVGLPDRALVLACFNQTYKLTQPFVSIWIDVLREHPDAVLWLWVPHALARHNLRAFAEAKGVAGARIVFALVARHAEHMARLRCADLALDVLPYGSHTSGSDALWAGVPLLTCRGSTFAGRVGASLCQAAGLPELVTETLADYARELRTLCGDRDRLAHYHQHLESERERLPLFDTETFTRAFERLLEDAANAMQGR